MTFRPGYEFERTAEEMASAEASWRRDDRAFFAAGACHVLAFAFVERFPDFAVVFIKPRGDFPGTHVYASDGEWSFDHNGVMRLPSFITAVWESYSAMYPGWFADFLPVDVHIEEFCSRHDHTLPTDFHQAPWAPRAPWDRADRYIDRTLLRQATAGL